MKRMSIGRRLALLIGVCLLCIEGVAVLGIQQTDQSAQRLSDLIDHEVNERVAALEIVKVFKTQVQEWKDVLLRGKDPAALDKYWQAFERDEADVQARAHALLRQLPAGESRESLSRFIEAHATMGERYRQGLDAFQRSGFDPAAGDVAVKGMDRAPTDLLWRVAELQKSAVDTALQSSVEARQNTYERTLAVLSLTVIAGLVCGALIARAVVREIGGEPGEAREAARRIARGDLSMPIPVRVGDRGTLFAALREMQDGLSGIVGQVRCSSDSIATGTAQIASGNADLSQRTEVQASSVQQTAASMEQLSGTVRSSVEIAQEANRLASRAADAARAGGGKVHQLVEAVQGLSASSQRIADIVGVIDGIAFQTNILALNASVEAARAGAQGRGFAVVAGEVRTLAQRSADAAKEIKVLVSATIERAQAGSRQVEDAGASMHDIVAQAQGVSRLIGELSHAAAEQSQGLAQAGGAVQLLDRVTQQNAALVEETAAAAESLHQQAQHMAQAMSFFKLGLKSVSNKTT